MKYIFTSDRLGFRNWKQSDKDQFSEMNQDPDVMRFFPTIPTTSASYKAVERFSNHYNNNGFTYFAVDHLGDNTFIGFIGMMNQDYDSPYTPFIDIGWRLRKEYWGKGLATEGALACQIYAKETLKLTEVYSVATWNNIPSMNVMKKIGMKKIGEFIHPGFDAQHELQPVWVFK